MVAGVKTTSKLKWKCKTQTADTDGQADPAWCRETVVKRVSEPSNH